MIGIPHNLKNYSGSFTRNNVVILRKSCTNYTKMLHGFVTNLGRISKDFASFFHKLRKISSKFPLRLFQVSSKHSKIILQKFFKFPLNHTSKIFNNVRILIFGRFLVFLILQKKLSSCFVCQKETVAFALFKRTILLLMLTVSSECLNILELESIS